MRRAGAWRRVERRRGRGVRAGWLGSGWLRAGCSTLVVWALGGWALGGWAAPAARAQTRSQGPAQQLEAWIAAGQVERAEAMLRSQIARREAAGLPPAPAFERLLGRLLLHDLRLAEAEVHLERATALRPDVSRWWRELASARAEAGRCDAALEAYDRALALDPPLEDAIRTRVDRARCARRTDRLDQAERDLRAVLEVETPALDESETETTSASVARAQLRAGRELGDLLRDRGALDEAYAHLRAVAARAPRDAETWVLLGLVARDLDRAGVSDACGDPCGSAARAALERALALRPGDARALYALGRMLGPTAEGRELMARFAAAREREEVIENRRQYLQLTPRDLGVRRELATLLDAAGRADEAAREREIVGRLERPDS